MKQRKEKYVNKIIFQTSVKQCYTNKKNLAMKSFFS